MQSVGHHHLYEYSPLAPGPNSFRLLEILPADELKPSSQPKCRLYNYSPDECSIPIPDYEALSYVWGHPHKTKSIEVNEKILYITENLYAALMQLRIRGVQWTWIDAICINQDNKQERGHQVRSMARIYGKAHHVIVWLGEEACGSDIAFEAIRNRSTSKNDDDAKKAIIHLLERPYFRRIWVRPSISELCIVTDRC